MEKLAELAAKIGISFKEGQTVFSQGDEGNTMFIIQQGSVVIIRERDGVGTVVARLKAGEFFGEMALVDQEPRSATVKAVERTVLVPITRDFFLKQSSKNTRFIQTVMETIGLRLEKIDEMLRWRFSDPGVAPDPADIEVTEEPLSADFLKSISTEARSSKAIHFNKDELIFGQGQPGDAMYIILEGMVEIGQETDRIRLVQARYGRGNFFGEMAIISGHSRSATARAVAPTVLLPITGEVFLKKVKSRPEVAFHIVQILILRLRRALNLLG